VITPTLYTLLLSFLQFGTRYHWTVVWHQLASSFQNVCIGTKSRCTHMWWALFVRFFYFTVFQPRCASESQACTSMKFQCIIGKQWQKKHGALTLLVLSCFMSQPRGSSRLVSANRLRNATKSRLCWYLQFTVNHSAPLQSIGQINQSIINWLINQYINRSMSC